MKKSLVLSMLAAVVLTGCGGGGGGGGGSGSGSSSPAPVIKYNLQFVKLEAKTAVLAGCTVFDGLGQNFDDKYYAFNAVPKRIEIHDENGVQTSTVVQLSNSVSISANDVPDGGYVSIIDYVPGYETYQVISIQKLLLGNYLLRLNSSSNKICYKKNQGLSTKSGYASVDANKLASNYYTFESSLGSFAKDSTASLEVSAYTNEHVLGKGYDGVPANNNLVGYAFVKNLTPNEEGQKYKFEPVNEDRSWSTDFDIKDLSHLYINLQQGDYIYPWLEADVNTKADFRYVSDKDGWAYKAEGKTKNWNFTHRSAFSGSLDIGLSINIDSDTAPEVTSGTGSTYLFEAKGYTASNDLIQRSYYHVVNSAINAKLTHIIYSVPDTNGETVIPELKNISGLIPKDAIAANINVSIAAQQTRTSDFNESFMRSYQPIDPTVPLFQSSEDAISLLLTPSDVTEQRKNIEMKDYTLLSR